MVILGGGRRFPRRDRDREHASPGGHTSAVGERRSPLGPECAPAWLQNASPEDRGARRGVEQAGVVELGSYRRGRTLSGWPDGPE